jgi:hypothetical protein
LGLALGKDTLHISVICDLKPAKNCLLTYVRVPRLQKAERASDWRSLGRWKNECCKGPMMGRHSDGIDSRCRIGSLTKTLYGRSCHLLGGVLEERRAMAGAGRRILVFVASLLHVIRLSRIFRVREIHVADERYPGATQWPLLGLPGTSPGVVKRPLPNW